MYDVTNGLPPSAWLNADGIASNDPGTGAVSTCPSLMGSITSARNASRGQKTLATRPPTCDSLPSPARPPLSANSPHLEPTNAQAPHLWTTPTHCTNCACHIPHHCGPAAPIGQPLHCTASTDSIAVCDDLAGCQVRSNPKP
jgi:hypothetical protein